MTRRLGAVLGAAALLSLVVVAPVAAQEIGDAISGDLGPADVLTLGGASVVVSILVGVLLSALGWTKAENAAKKTRYGPLLSIAVGVVVVGGFAIVQSADPVAAFLTGLLAGNGAMGIHDLVRTATG